VTRERGAKRFAIWLSLAVSGPLAGFGTRMRGVIVALALLVIGFAGLLATNAGATVENAKRVKVTPGFFEDLRFSLGQLVTTPPGNVKLAGHGWEAAASVETFIGISLLGLLGFVLANKLRFS
jgi:hypothetical protein